MSNHNTSSIVSFIHYLRIAKEYAGDFQRDFPKSKNLLSDAQNKIEYIKNTLLCNPNFPKEVRDGIRQEWDGDVLIFPELNRKQALLKDTQLVHLELIVDALLEGKSIEYNILDGVLSKEIGELTVNTDLCP